MLKISILLLDIERVLSKVANLASDYGCSSPYTLRDMTLFWIFFQNFSENIDINNSTILEITISVVVLCQDQGTLRSCEFCRRI